MCKEVSEMKNILNMANSRTLLPEQFQCSGEGGSLDFRELQCDPETRN